MQKKKEIWTMTWCPTAEAEAAAVVLKCSHSYDGSCTCTQMNAVFRELVEAISK